MVLEVGDEERILFRQACTFDKAEGNLVVTNVRVHWSSSTADGTTDFQTPWTSVEKTQYCEPAKMKGKAGIKLDLNAGTRKNAMFMLKGSDRAQQLESLKIIVREIMSSRHAAAPRETDVAANSASKPSYSSSSSKRRLQEMLSSHGDEAQRAAELAARRKELLESDKTLATHYKQLCSGATPILTDEEFWLAHMPEYATELYRKESDDYAQRGRMPLKSRVPMPGSGKLKLTADDIKQVLEEDAVVRRAYIDLVPHQKTEKEFWQLYVDKYFHRTLQSGQADQLFARYERKTQSTLPRSTQDVAEASGLQKHGIGTSGSWKNGSDLSLLDTYADSDRPERYAAEDTCHTLGESVRKLVGESSFIIASASKSNLTDADADADAGVINAKRNIAAELRTQQNKFTELENQRPPEYAPLLLKQSTLNAEKPPKQKLDTAKSGGFGKRPSGGGFGKASASIRRGHSKAGARDPLPDSKTLLSTLGKVIPDAERAHKFLIATRNQLQSLADNTRRKHSSLLGSSAESEFRLMNIGITGDDEEMENQFVKSEVLRHEALLSSDFKTYASETFAVIVEYLRHMYILIARSNGESDECHQKIAKIIEHLEVISQKLTGRKNTIRAAEATSSIERNAAIRVVDELLRMITRAKTTASVSSKIK